VIRKNCKLDIYVVRIQRVWHTNSKELEKKIVSLEFDLLFVYLMYDCQYVRDEA